MKPSGRTDPVVTPKGTDQNTPLDGHWWRSTRPATALFSSLLDLGLRFDFFHQCLHSRE